MGKKVGKGKGKGRKIEESPEPTGVSKYLNDVSSGNIVDDRHALYQRAVQSPKGDISYLLKFFLTYVGGRVPLHLREDFCGTALICTEWLKGDARRTALGLDLDDDALNWGVAHNLSSLPETGKGRVCLLEGNVLNSLEHAKLFFPAREREEAAQVIEGAVDGLQPSDEDEAIRDGKLAGSPAMADGSQQEGESEVRVGQDDVARTDTQAEQSEGRRVEADPGEGREVEEDEGDKNHEVRQEMLQSRGADITCAFNFSTCCLHTRKSLLRYFRHVKKGLSTKGGVFAMDLYGGMSSECPLKLKRRFGDFTYTWEQEEFDAVTRMTRISLHFVVEASKRSLRRAFSYQWRLWTIPEVVECLEEAGFEMVRVWMREMPNLLEREDEDEEVEADPRNEYKEVQRFLQCDAWGAYVVAVS